MSDVWFYHLQSQPLEAVLPGLVARSRERGWKVVIRAGSEARVQALDDLLWTYETESFLPHGLASDPAPETQPVLLTTEDGAPNAADVLFLVDGTGLPEAWPFTRVVMMFDGNDMDAVATARSAWKAAKGLGHAVTYWQQDDAGRWVKKA